MHREVFPSPGDELTPEERALLEQLEHGDDELEASRRGAPSTRVADDVRMEGTLVSRGPIHIAGVLVGDATSADAIVVEPPARITGHLSAVDVVVNGRVSGDIRARRRLELAAGADLSGNLLEQPEVLVIHERARFGRS
ncbi:polymer-forming cytoskeletal protein [bacterium]|nr:polymer-forming cytoskeletal protein [bacterium]